MFVLAHFDNQAVIRVVCGDISNLLTEIDEYQTDNKVQFVRQILSCLPLVNVIV